MRHSQLRVTGDGVLKLLLGVFHALERGNGALECRYLRCEESLAGDLLYIRVVGECRGCVLQNVDSSPVQGAQLLADVFEIGLVLVQFEQVAGAIAVHFSGGSIHFVPVGKAGFDGTGVAVRAVACGVEHVLGCDAMLFVNDGFECCSTGGSHLVDGKAVCFSVATVWGIGLSELHRRYGISSIADVVVDLAVKV